LNEACQMCLHNFILRANGRHLEEMEAKCRCKDLNYPITTEAHVQDCQLLYHDGAAGRLRVRRKKRQSQNAAAPPEPMYSPEADPGVRTGFEWLLSGGALVGAAGVGSRCGLGRRRRVDERGDPAAEEVPDVREALGHQRFESFLRLLLGLVARRRVVLGVGLGARRLGAGVANFPFLGHDVSLELFETAAEEACPVQLAGLGLSRLARRCAQPCGHGFAPCPESLAAVAGDRVGEIEAAQLGVVDQLGLAFRRDGACEHAQLQEDGLVDLALEHDGLRADLDGRAVGGLDREHRAALVMLLEFHVQTTKLQDQGGLEAVVLALDEAVVREALDDPQQELQAVGCTDGFALGGGLGLRQLVAQELLA